MNVMGLELNIPPEAMKHLNMDMSYEEYLQWQCDSSNAAVGRLTGLNCPKCRNKGIVYIVRDREIICRKCECMNTRDSIYRIEKSGIKDTMDRYTFESYHAENHWQQEMKRIAMDYANNPEGWLIICGQVGCGKTHLCTAVVSKLLNDGKSARYMQWRDDIVRIKACVNDDYAYQSIIDPLKSTDVLYIDDFFKTEYGKSPTQGDINAAFEIVDHRYKSGLPLIISCEMTVDDLIGIDEGIGSRIYQRTKGHNVVIGRDRAKNYRLREDKP